jgi:hypothetical protein
VAKKFVVLCSKDLEKITKPKNEAAPEADPKPTIAGHVMGPFASAEIAETAIMGYACEGKHFICEAIQFRRLFL